MKIGGKALAKVESGRNPVIKREGNQGKLTLFAGFGIPQNDQTPDKPLGKPRKTNGVLQVLGRRESAKTIIKSILILQPVVVI